MDLRVFSKLELSVLHVIDGEPSDYLAWTEVPPTDGEDDKALSQKITRPTSSPIILPGILLKDKVL